MFEQELEQIKNLTVDENLAPETLVSGAVMNLAGALKLAVCFPVNFLFFSERKFQFGQSFDHLQEQHEQSHGGVRHGPGTVPVFSPTSCFGQIKNTRASSPRLRSFIHSFSPSSHFSHLWFCSALLVVSVLLLSLSCGYGVSP